VNVTIQYTAQYRYESVVSLSPHRVRLFPRPDYFVRVDAEAFSTESTADVQYRNDLFDNPFAYCFYPTAISDLHFSLKLSVRLRERNPFHFLLDSHALKLPFLYKPDELAVLHPYLSSGGGTLNVPDPLRLPSPRPTVETLMSMVAWLNENIGYERREEGPARAPEETLRLGRGACRDTANLFVAVLRQLGIAARLTSGFLWEPPTSKRERRAVGAMHAWVEAYLPGAGWVGMDPTNGVLCDHHFIATAVGMTPEDIMPISGSYYGNRKVGSEMTYSLEIVPLGTL